MNKIKIKICGITRKEDALLAAELGAWAIGFIFVKNTPRYISPENAAEIIKAIGNLYLRHSELVSESNSNKTLKQVQGDNFGQCDSFVQGDNNIEKVGVFADESLEEIKNIALQTGITKIQLHGDESPEFCENLAKITGKEIIKAIKVKTNCHSEACFASREIDCRVGALAPPRNDSYIYKYKDKVSFVLLDSYSESQLGGTGKAFDWEIAKKAKEYGIPIILAGGLNPVNARQAYEAVKPYALDVSSGVELSKGIKDSEKLRKLFDFGNTATLKSFLSP